MAFTNINDPAGVKLLLEQLRTSQAWQDTVGQTLASTTTKSSELDPSSRLPSTGSEGTSSVAALLLQLQSLPAGSSAVPSPPTCSPAVYAPTTLASGTDPSVSAQFGQSSLRSPSARQDIRAYTFQQSLPHLAQLSDDPDFLVSLSAMKRQQAEFEQRLFQERCAIQAKHEEKVKVAQAKAKIFGADISKHEADMMSDAYRKELHKFDSERVLVAWDGLIVKQQAALENMAVPAMFVTETKTDRERQQRVIQVLESIERNEDTG